MSSAVVKSSALTPLVGMLCSEHAVMRNEALLALTLVSSSHLPLAEQSLAESKVVFVISSVQSNFIPLLFINYTLHVFVKVCAKVADLLTEYGTTMEKPMLCNTLALLGELVLSGNEKFYVPLWLANISLIVKQ